LERQGIRRRLKDAQEWRFVEQPGGPPGVVMAAKQEKGAAIEDAKFDGECFLFQINKMSTGTRGRPEILPLIDWLDRYDQLFFDGAEHVAALRYFFWDLQVEGGSEGSEDLNKNLQYQANKIAGSRPGGVYAHNPDTVLKAVNPDLKTPELQVMLRALRVFIAGGQRIPEHWIAEGGYTNRATAKEMGQPTFRMLTRKQRFVQRMMTRMVQYQLDVLVALGHLPAEVPVYDEEGEQATDSEGEAVTMPTRDAFEIVLPDINVQDTTSAAQAFSYVADAVSRLVVTNVLPMRPAVELLAAVAQVLGVELDIDKIVDANAEDEAQRKALGDLIANFDKERDRSKDQNGAGGAGEGVDEDETEAETA
jgi:hypothetical protein